MSLQGTWANHIIIQAVADAMNLKIHIIESDSNFREVTVVEPANATTNIRIIYIGHIGQMSQHVQLHISKGQMILTLKRQFQMIQKRTKMQIETKILIQAIAVQENVTELLI